MSYTALAHVATGDLATAALHNELLDDITFFKGMFDSNGKLMFTTRAISTSQLLLLGSDDDVFCTSTIIVSLPDPTTCNGKLFNIKNVGAGVITINVTTGGNIDDAATVVLSNPMDTRTVKSDGIQWWLQ